MKNKLNILGIILIISIVVLVFYIINLNVLPLKFLIPVLIIILLLLVCCLVLINRKKKCLKILGIILTIIFTFSNMVLIYHINNINKFLNKSFSETTTQKIPYYVIGLAKNHDTNKNIDKDIAYYTYSVNVDRACSLLEEKYNISTDKFDDIKNMFDSLFNEKYSYILLEKSNYNIITELDKDINTSDLEVVEEFNILKKITTNKKEKDSFNIYVGGNDYAGLMDFNTIITVNTKTNKILLTAIPRDTYLDVYGYDYKNKLSFITEGIDVSKNSLAKFFDIEIDYYVKIDWESVMELIDKIGGIEYCSDYAYSGTANYYKNGRLEAKTYNIRKGCQLLDGKGVIAASRTRNSFNGRDRIRQKNMQKIIISIFNKLSTRDVLLNYEDIINSLSSSFTTDIPKKMITKNIKNVINNGNKWQIETQSIDGEDKIGRVHRFDYLDDWLLIPDMSTVDAARENIKNTLK